MEHCGILARQFFAFLKKKEAVFFKRKNKL